MAETAIWLALGAILIAHASSMTSLFWRVSALEEEVRKLRK